MCVGGLSVCAVGVLGVVLSVRFVMRVVVSVGVLEVRPSRRVGVGVMCASGRYSKSSALYYL